jgi:hypothetical protein
MFLVMRRAALIFGLFCVSAFISPVALRAAADTDSRADAGSPGAPKTASLPPAVNQKPLPPPSATLSSFSPRDPHPFVTEFFGPAKPAAKPAASKRMKNTQESAAATLPAR